MRVVFDADLFAVSGLLRILVATVPGPHFLQIPLKLIHVLGQRVPTADEPGLVRATDVRLEFPAVQIHALDALVDRRFQNC